MTTALRQTKPDMLAAQDLPAAAPLQPEPAVAATQPVQVPLGLTLLPPAPPPPPDLRHDPGTARLAAALGLTLTPGLIRLDRGGFASAMARGRVEAGRIILHPDRFRPDLPEGRAVIAHEMAHLAQARLASRSGPLIPAELEARDIGQRAAEGRALPRVIHAVAPGVVLYDETLSDLVRTRYATELARFRDHLRGWLGFLWVTDSAIRSALTLVEGLDVEVVKSFATQLTAGERAAFLENVSPSHFARFRREILAIYSVTEAALIAEQDENLFRGMDFSGLQPAEVVAIGAIFAKGFPATAIAALRADPEQGPHLARLLDTDLRDRAAALYDEAGAGERALTALQAERNARAKAAKAVRDDKTGTAAIAIARLRSLLTDPGDADRIAALDTLAGFLPHPQIFEGILEAVQPPETPEGPLDRMLDGFPGRALVEPVASPAEGGPAHSRIETLLRVATLRPPWKNVALAEDLLTSFWIFNVLTSSEAFLAFQLIKALPDAVRTGLLEEDRGRLGTLLHASLSQSMREAAGSNFYRGGEGRTDLASIQTQLIDDALWGPAEIGRLGGLIRMAGAAGEQEWLFTRSRQASAANPAGYEDAAFQAQIVGPYMLFGSPIRGGGIRTAWEPAYGSWAVEGVWDMLGEGFATVGRGFVLLGDSREPGALIGNALFGRSLGGEGISAVALQDLMGGSFMGIRFVSPEDRIADPELATEVAAADEADRGVNYIDRALWDTDRGVVEMVANRLAVAAVRYPLGDMLISTGAGRITGMELRLGYPTRETGPRPTTMALEISTLELKDLLIVMRGSMLAINRVALTGLKVDLGRNAIAGDLPQAGRGVDWTTLNPITPILRLIGLTLGSELSDRSGEIVTGLTEPTHAWPLVISIDALTLTGVQTSGGQYIETVQLEEAQIGIAGTVDDYRDILWHSVRATISHKLRLILSLEAMPQGAGRTRVEERIAKLQTRVEALQGLMREILAAQATVERLAPQESRLSPADHQALDAARAVLAPYHAGGITFDAGRLRVSGMQGRVTASGVALTDVHGRGQGSAGLLAFLTDNEAVARIIEGPAHVSTTAPLLGRERADFTLDLGDITLDEVRIGAGIPTVAEAEEAQRSAEAALAERTWDPGLQSARDQTAGRADATRRYHQLAATGVTYLSPADARELTRLHDSLLAAEAFYLHHLDATGARLGFSAGSGAVNFGADTFVATGDAATGTPAIRVGGVTLGRAEGRNVDLSVGVSGGLHGFGDFIRRLASVGISGDFLEVQDVAHGASGMRVDKAEAAAFDLSLDARQGVFRGQAGRIGAEGIRGRITRPWVMEQITALENKPADRMTEADRTTLRQMRDALDVLDDFEARLAENAAAIAAATDPATRTRLASQRQMAIEAFLTWEQRLGARTAEVQGLDVEVTGLGNLAENGFDFGAAVDRGVTVQGRGQGTDRSDRGFSTASFTDARFGGIEAGTVALGETSGRLRYSTTEIAIDDLGIASLTLGAVSWNSMSEVTEAQGGGMSITQIFSQGSTVASGIRVSAVLRFAPTVEDPQQYRLEHVSLGPLRVDRLEAAGLGYASDRHPPVYGMTDPQGIYASQIFSLDGGAILGLWAEGIEIDMPDTAADEMRVTGRAGVASVSGTRAFGLLENTLTGQARLDGSALSIQFLESGGRIIDIGTRTETDGRVSYAGGLRLSEGEATLAAGSAAFSTGTITGRVVTEGDVTRLEGIAVPSVTLQRLSFAAGGKSLSASSPVRLTGILIDASYESGDRDNSRITLDRLRIGTISGDDLSVVWPPYSLRIRQDPSVVRLAESMGTAVPPPLQISGVEVDNLNWSTRGGITPAAGAGRAHVGAESVHIAFQLLGADMDLASVVDAKGLRFDFLRDGTQELQIEEVDASFRGQAAAGVQVDVRIDDLATGTVTINGRTLTVPALSVPTLSLNALSVDSPALRLQMPRWGGRIVLTGTTASAVIVMSEPGSRAPFETMTIDRLLVPTVTMEGVMLTLPDKVEGDDGTMRDLTLTIPASETVTLINLTLGGLSGPSAFVITPDPTGVAGPQIDGRLHLDRAQGNRLGLEIERQLHATSDIEATTLDFDFLGAGGSQFTLAELELMRTRVGLGEHGGARADHLFTITTGTGGSSRAALPHATIRGLSYGADGSVSITSAALAGLVYRRPDWGVEIDIGSAELPPGAAGTPALRHVPGDRLVIPELTIRDAAFSVDDVMAIGGAPAPGGATTPPVLANMDFLDALHGTIGLTLGHPSLPNFVSERLDLELTHGVFNLDQIENEIGADFAVDFDLEDDRLVLNFDWGNATPLPGPWMPWFNKELTAFHLQTQTEIDEADNREIRLSTMVNRFESSGSGGGGGGEVSLSVRDIIANLMLEETRVDLTDHGSILLGGSGVDGAIGIVAQGGLFPMSSGVPSQIDLTVQQVNASIDPAHPLTFGGVTARTGELTITDVHDTRLTFSGVTTPRRLSGVIRGAVIRNLEVKGL